MGEAVHIQEEVLHFYGRLERKIAARVALELDFLEEELANGFRFQLANNFRVSFESSVLAGLAEALAHDREEPVLYKIIGAAGHVLGNLFPEAPDAGGVLEQYLVVLGGPAHLGETRIQVVQPALAALLGVLLEADSLEPVAYTGPIDGLRLFTDDAAEQVVLLFS